MDLYKKKIYIAGHNGMVGSAILRQFEARGAENIITVDSSSLDLRNQYEVSEFFADQKPEIVINAAAKVGGILANDSQPYQFLMDNLMIQNNLIDFSLKSNVEKFLFLGSSCVYPKKSEQPIKEEYLLSGPLEPTNESYAIAKIAGIRACQAINKTTGKWYCSIMPSNLYGPKDNFDLKSSHVLPALIRKFHESKINGNQPVILWGSGSPLREFLHVEDLASAVIFLLERELTYSLINVGSGFDIEIKKLAELVQHIVGNEADIIWDSSMPDGTYRKLMDVSKIRSMGWSPRLSLLDGVSSTYKWYLSNQQSLKMHALKS